MLAGVFVLAIGSIVKPDRNVKPARNMLRFLSNAEAQHVHCTSQQHRMWSKHVWQGPGLLKTGLRDAINTMNIMIFLNVTVVGMVVCTSIWVQRDSSANRISIDGKPYSTNNGAWAWFTSCILLWIAAFPYYLHRRSKLMNERRGGAKAQFHLAAVTPAPDAEQELRKFARLKHDGLISDTDYDHKKRQLLGV